ncbi:MAG: hypothetical protein GC138_03635 [Gammaproteobacteria bacterium]|nr:hypothetical protein [Gammaproteobacteria bacterium]
MKRSILLNLLLSACIAVPLAASADEFNWQGALGLTGKADLNELKIALGTRFRIGDTKVDLLVSNMESPEDSYMVLRLSELSHRPVEDVLKVYKTDHGRGWGSMARRLGIKPGSAEFHALKSGQDLADADELEFHRHVVAHSAHGRGHGGNKH